MKLFKGLIEFVKERHAIYTRRQADQSKPWTKDPILQQYRFCNVYRELDMVTVWIRKNWREPHANDPDLWFAMAVARLINWPAALEVGGLPTPWKPKIWKYRLLQMQNKGLKVFTGAYMIRCDKMEGATKVEYLADRVLQPLWERRREGRQAFLLGSLSEAHSWLKQQYGFGSFLAAQVIADVKYTPLLARAADWWTWAAPGPGSLRGMSRVEFGIVGTSYTNEEWRAALAELKAKIDPLIKKAGMPAMHAQDLQNCLCEFDKYERARLGEGRPRSKYPGKKGD